MERSSEIPACKKEDEQGKAIIALNYTVLVIPDLMCSTIAEDAESLRG